MSKILSFLLLGVALWSAGNCLIVENWHSTADDFTSIYVAARLLADGNDDSLYDHHPFLFDIVPPGEFTDTARKIGFAGFLHPYVHIPLVAFLLRPLLSIPYRAVTVMLLLINVLSVAVSLWLMVKLLCGRSRLMWLSIAGIAAVYYYPLRYSLSLGQTSPLVFLGIVVLYYLLRTGHEKSAGAVLGGMIGLKITPLLLVFFFMARRRWAAVLSCAVTLLVIGLGSVVLAGWESNRAFLGNLFRLSGLSLASWNNQSLDGFLLRLTSDRSYLSSWHLLALPPGMRLLSGCICAALAVLWLRMLLRPAPPQGEDRDLLDYALTIILMVLLPPVSWTHYFVALLFPYGVLLRRIARPETMPYRGLLGAAVLLSYLCVSLPPSYLGVTDPLSYFEFLAGFPLLTRLPLVLKSSLGFLGTVLLLLLVVVVVERLRNLIPSKTNKQDSSHSFGMTFPPIIKCRGDRPVAPTEQSLFSSQ